MAEQNESKKVRRTLSRRRYKAGYNKGYRAGRLSNGSVVHATPQRKSLSEVILNIGDVKVSIVSRAD